MSLESKIPNLQQRAIILKNIRAFFADKNVLEVETPLLADTTTLDVHIHSLQAHGQYLQTSPEFAMKQLLAAGSGCIYQICKAFRAEESGRLHHQEFTMLEWYRVGFDHHQLMDEMDAFLHAILNAPKATRISYQTLFQEYLNINPHTATLAELKQCLVQQAIHIQSELDKDECLNLLMSTVIEPHLGVDAPVFIYHYPTSQAALAKCNNGVAERFEVYINGIELANGYHELTDAQEQRKRFQAEQTLRAQKNLPILEIDERLLESLKNGFPSCAGVALGIDRLIMLKLKSKTIDSVKY